jgi:hypothetical protein
MKSKTGKNDSKAVCEVYLCLDERSVLRHETRCLDINKLCMICRRNNICRFYTDEGHCGAFISIGDMLENGNRQEMQTQS